MAESPVLAPPDDMLRKPSELPSETATTSNDVIVSVASSSSTPAALETSSSEPIKMETSFVLRNQDAVPDRLQYAQHRGE